MTKRVIILGSTGSIGTQTLEVIAHLNALHQRGEFPHALQVVGLVCGRNDRLLKEQAERFGVEHTACAHLGGKGTAGVERLRGDRRCFAGEDGAAELVRHAPCDLVVAAMVGSAGIRATVAALERGRDVALANKETLVAAGALIVPLAARSGAKLLPIDSEHAALWQCLAGEHAPPYTASSAVSRVILTASGGPFRTWTRQQIWGAGPEQALKHPTWSMGRKVTVDSASLMNKALEVIEAHWLFGLPAAKIEAIVHPQSLVHAIAEYGDGNVVAQLAAPDMRTPIQHALTWPHRAGGVSRKIDWTALRSLEFEPVDHERFPLLRLAYRAIGQGGTAGAILNAANEAAVGAFLHESNAGGGLRFGVVIETVLEAVESIRPSTMQTIDDCLQAEAEARAFVAGRLGIP
jgi:1-deoxy-D-xylulose-5-phosphate reductoisomerase